MEKVKKYRSLVREIIQSEYESLLDNPNKAVKPLFIQDEKNGHYMLCLDGWQGARRIYGCSIHVEVTGQGKIWLHLDETDLQIGQMLLEKGVPKKDIVPGFISPVRRPDTEFAVA
ncbi:MAG: XisI protein [Bacteroidota bacterium]